MYMSGIVTCCPLCKIVDKSENIGRSKEFGVPFVLCNNCTHMSVRDLRHGIENDAIRSNLARSLKYSKAINDIFSTEDSTHSLLEIGPGDYSLSNKINKAKVTTIDVGESFLNLKNKNLVSFNLKSPENPDQVWEITDRMGQIIESQVASNNNSKFSIGVSLHSLEHSPNPLGMIMHLSKNCEDFVIEVPNGGDKFVVNSTICSLDNKGPFPIFSKKAKKGGKGALVGGHYQIFTKDSLRYVVENFLPKDKEYFIGGSIHYSKHTIVLSTIKSFVIE